MKRNANAPGGHPLFVQLRDGLFSRLNPAGSTTAFLSQLLFSQSPGEAIRTKAQPTPLAASHASHA